MAEAGAREGRRGRRKELGGRARALALFGEAAPSRNYTYHEFNNLAGTLTGGPKAFPYAFTVRRRRVNFSDSELLPEPRRPRGPFACLHGGGARSTRPAHGGPVDRDTGKVVRRPVSRLNLDVDLKCCLGCSARFSSGADRSTKTSVSGPWCPARRGHCESLLRLAKVSAASSRGRAISRTGDSLGKIAVYQRAAVSKPKLSMRLLWYLPTELCSFEGIEAYRPLLEEIEKTSLGYTLLSYPAEASRCGLCELRGSIARGGRRDLCPRQLRLGEPDRSARGAHRWTGPVLVQKVRRGCECGKEDLP
ncbi:hypothetical protein Q5P01_000802 [Channa striata]|uniref:Uncharacterized protein n=1 Tax=Channa striata TaxID=64152 RepID=A0AA88LIT0_CHASR|nr:hypothetical protein Q5P01_000802 [Channa striata]